MDSHALSGSHDVIILAGGLGKRLRHALDGLPKPMVPIMGKPFLEWMILYLRSKGFGSYILSVGYKREVIKNHFHSGKRWGVKIRYVEEDTPLGTGGALKKALRRVTTPEALVLNGDSLCTCDIHDFFQFHRIHEGAVTLCCVRIDDPSRYGSVSISRGSRIEAFVEKDRIKRRSYINSGMYWMKKVFGSELDARVPLSLEKDVFPGLIGGALYAYRSNADFIDIGTVGSLASAPDFLKRNGFLEI